MIREVVQRRQGLDEKKFFCAKCGLLSASYGCDHAKFIMSLRRERGSARLPQKAQRNDVYQKKTFNCYRMCWVNSNQTSLLYITPEIPKGCRHQYWTKGFLIYVTEEVYWKHPEFLGPQTIIYAPLCHPNAMYSRFYHSYFWEVGVKRRINVSLPLFSVSMKAKNNTTSYKNSRSH